MVGFIFGGNTNETPESLKRKRELIEAMISGQRPPQNVGQGIGAVMSGIAAGIQRSRLDRAETQGRKSGDDVYNRVVNWMTGGQPSGGSVPMPGASAELSATTPGATPDMTGNQVYSGFMDTVKNGIEREDGTRLAVTNPYALAAVAATGNAESQFSPGNLNRTWSDPSESGQSGTAGGAMSWRGPRLQAMQAYGQSKGEQVGAISPQTQAEFFLQEDPSLIAALNNAGSLEEAQALMNNAWKFAGYNRPGGEAAKRLSSAQSYLPGFQGGGEVASLDAASAIDAVAPQTGQEIPMGGTQQFDMGRFDSGNLSEAPIVGRQGLQSALTGSNQQMGAQPLPVESMPQVEVAQASSQQMPVQQQGMAGPSLQELLAAASHPWVMADPQKAAAVNMMLERELKRQDPGYQLETEYKRAQIDALRAKDTTSKKQVVNAGDGRIFVYDPSDPAGGQWMTPPGQGGGQTGGFRFQGKSVEAEALNGLMDSGKLTVEQAQQLGAGKTITGPDGEIIFLTPQGVFGSTPGGPTSQLSGDQPLPEGSATKVGRGGNIQVTEPKVTLDERKAMGFADRMTQSGAKIDQFTDAGLGVWDQFARNNSLIPDKLENWLISGDFQQFDQARRNFINAQLRRESGAVISDEEFDNANQQYFPQPGDGKEVLLQKAANRQTVIGAMARDAGPTYQGVGGDPLADARAAIKAGANREAVIERLRQNGINPEGL